MKHFGEIEEIKMNTVPFWIEFKIGPDFEVKILESTKHGN
jgi:hypothetical protein